MEEKRGEDVNEGSLEKTLSANMYLEHVNSIRPRYPYRLSVRYVRNRIPRILRAFQECVYVCVTYTQNYSKGKMSILTLSQAARRWDKKSMLHYKSHKVSIH